MRRGTSFRVKLVGVATRRSPRWGLVLLVPTLALGAIGCGDDDNNDQADASPADTAETADTYADDVCSAASEWLDDIASIRESLSPALILNNADPALYVRQLAGDAVTATRQLATKLGDANPPDTDVGNQISASLDETRTTLADAVDEALGGLEAASAAGPASVVDWATGIANDVSAAGDRARASVADLTEANPGDELSEAIESSEACDALRS